MAPTVLMLHPQAPPKPACGAPCNGCGVCCALEPCPAAMLLHRRRTGPCPRLQWSQPQQRYVCGLLAPLQQAPGWWAALRRAWVQRWIAADSGCDCTVQVQPMASSATSAPESPAPDATH
ncbi:MAG: hypothetical protein ACT4NV_01915 [Rhodoferax sp.]